MFSGKTEKLFVKTSAELYNFMIGFSFLMARTYKTQ